MVGTAQERLCPPTNHAERRHQRAVLRFAVCQNWQSISHLSKNIRQTTTPAGFSGVSPMPPPSPSEPHDVGSEYAVYMVVPAVKSAFRET
jgi:hypothetical protein